MRPLSQITEADERERSFAGTQENLHAALSAIALHPNVPPNVQELFDTARNVSLYAWFVYEFHPIAELTGFLALEAAMKTRARSESPQLARERSFRKLIEAAVARGWIAEERIAHRREIARGRVIQRKTVEAIKRSMGQDLDSVPIDEPTEEEIAKEAADMKIIESVCEAAISLRNALAHGERLLAPGSHRRLRMTADLINQLYT